MPEPSPSTLILADEADMHAVLGSVTRELRAPLAQIRGWADVIIAESSSNPNIEVAAHALVEAVSQITRTLSQLSPEVAATDDPAVSASSG